MPLITVNSPHTVRATIDRVLGALESRDIHVFARIDHAAGARAVGLELADEELVIFGDPRAGTPLMRLLAWDAGGQTRIGYRPPTELAADYEVTDRIAVLERMNQLLAQIVAESVDGR